MTEINTTTSGNDSFNSLPPEILNQIKNMYGDEKHFKEESDRLNEIKDKEDNVRIEIQKQVDGILLKSDELIKKLEDQAIALQALEVNKTNEYIKQLEKVNAATLEEINVGEYEGKIADFQRELQLHEKQRIEFNNEKELIAKDVSNIQSVQLELRNQLDQVQEELLENERLLTEAMNQRVTSEEKIQELRKLIDTIEENIKVNQQQIETLTAQQRELEIKKKDLEQQINQLNASIIKTEALLRDKEAKVARLEKDVQDCQEKIKSLEKELEQVRENIQTINEKMEKVNQELINCEQKFKELDNERKALEMERRQLEKTLQTLEDERTDRVNRLNRLQQKFIAIEDLFNRVETKVKQLEILREQQSAAVESLENERNRLEESKMTQTAETESLREQKEAAVNERQTAETEHKEAERALANAKQKERDANNQYQRALNEEQRIKSQLDRAIREETAAQNEMKLAESRVKNLEPTETMWNLVGAIIPVLGGFSQSEVQKVNRARTELDRAREKYESKQTRVSELRDKYTTAKDQRKNGAKLRDDAQKDATKQQTMAQVKVQNFNTCKAKADRLIEEHRSSLRKQQQTEASVRMVAIHLQKAQAQLSSTTNELAHNEQEKTTYVSQINELKSNLDDMREDLKRYQRTIDAHRTVMDENRTTLYEKQLQCQQEQSKLQLLKGESENLKRLHGDLTNTEKAKVREMTYQNDLLQAELKTVDDLRVEINTKKESLKSLNEQYLLNENDLQRIVQENNRLKTEKTTLNRELQQSKTDLSSAEVQYREVNRTYCAQNNKVETLRQKADMLNKRSIQISTNVEFKQETLNKKNLQIDQNRIAISEINGKMNAERLRRDHGQITIRTANEGLITMKENIKRIDTEISNKQITYDQLKEQLTQFHESAEATEAMKKENYKRLDKIEEVLTRLQQEHGELQKNHTTKIHSAVLVREPVSQTVTNNNTLTNRQRMIL